MLITRGERQRSVTPGKGQIEGHRPWINLDKGEYNIPDEMNSMIWEANTNIEL